MPIVYRSRISERSEAPGEAAEQLAALRADLARERLARAPAEEVLEETKVAARSLQTRLGQIELELREARERADRAEQEAEAMRAEK